MPVFWSEAQIKTERVASGRVSVVKTLNQCAGHVLLWRPPPELSAVV